MRGALAPSTRTTTTYYSPTLKKNNVRTKQGSIGSLRSSARKCAVVRVVRSEADNQPESSAAAGAKRSSASAEERERAETLRKVEDAFTSGEEIERNGRMDMDFNPEDFENVDPQLAEDVAGEDDRIEFGASFGAAEEHGDVFYIGSEGRGGGRERIKDGHGRDEENYGGEPQEGDGLHRRDGFEIRTRRQRDLTSNR